MILDKKNICIGYRLIEWKNTVWTSLYCLFGWKNKKNQFGQLFLYVILLIFQTSDKIFEIHKIKRLLWKIWLSMTSLLDPVLWLMARRRMRIPGWYQRKKPCMQIREHLPGENAPLFDSIGHIYFTGLANAKKFISVKNYHSRTARIFLEAFKESVTYKT